MTDSAVIDAVCYGDRSPSQWFVRLADGRVAYIRYRWGGLSATCIHGANEIELTDQAIFDCQDSEVWFDRLIGDNLDGEIELSRACEVLGLGLALKGAA